MYFQYTLFCLFVVMTQFLVTSYLFMCWKQVLSYWTPFACQSPLVAKPLKMKPLLLNCRHCNLH